MIVKIQFHKDPSIYLYLYICVYICIYLYILYIYIEIWSQRVDPKQWIYAIIVLQPFCNLYCAIFAMLCFFLQHFADNIEKQSVFLGFFEHILQKIQNLCFFATFCWKYGKTVGSPLFFCTRSAKASQNLCFLHYFAEHAGKRWFSFVSGAHIVKEPWMYNDFLHLFHTNTYTSTLHHGRKATLRVS